MLAYFIAKLKCFVQKCFIVIFHRFSFEWLFWKLPIWFTILSKSDPHFKLPFRKEKGGSFRHHSYVLWTKKKKKKKDTESEPCLYEPLIKAKSLDF